jgi:anti-sigma B factor antagonist
MHMRPHRAAVGKLVRAQRRAREHEVALALGVVADVTFSAGSSRLTLEGELDLATAPDLERALTFAERRRPEVVVVDLRGLTFMDLTGVRVLLDAQRRASEHGYRVAIVRGRGAVQRIVELAGVEPILTWIDDRGSPCRPAR